MDNIQKAIAASEAKHSGEIRFAVEASLDIGPLWKGLAVRERAIQVFSDLRIWDTAANNGVLIYLLLADHDVEIVADRGIASKLVAEKWETICQSMEKSLRAGKFEEAVLRAVEDVGRHLETHFPPKGGADTDELPNKPLIIG